MERRSLRPDERETLTNPRPHVSTIRLFWDVAVPSVGATGCLGLLALLAVGGIFRVLDVPPPAGFVATATIIGLILLVSAISTAARYSIRRKEVADLRSKIDADLVGGIAEIERHRCTAALRAILVEHRERAYFLRLVDGRALFVGFWNPAEDDNPALISGMPPDLPTYPGRDVEIARGPATRILLGVTFQGETLPVESTFEHQQRTQPQDVDVGDFVSVPWDQIPSVFG